MVLECVSFHVLLDINNWHFQDNGTQTNMIMSLEMKKNIMNKNKIKLYQTIKVKEQGKEKKQKLKKKKKIWTLKID